MPGSGGPTVPKRCFASVFSVDAAQLSVMPVALEHGHAAGVEELEDLGADRRGAGERQLEAAAERRADLREHELVGQRKAPAVSRPGRAPARSRRRARAPSAIAHEKTSRLTGPDSSTPPSGAKESTSVCSCDASMRPGVKGTFTSCPASFAAFSIAAQPPRTIRSASETFFPPDCEALNSFWIASSVRRTFAS